MCDRRKVRQQVRQVNYRHGSLLKVVTVFATNLEWGNFLSLGIGYRNPWITKSRDAKSRYKVRDAQIPYIKWLSICIAPVESSVYFKSLLDYLLYPKQCKWFVTSYTELFLK